MDLVNLLINESDIDYHLVNNQGFNVIHKCALKGHAGYVHILLIIFVLEIFESLVK